MLNFCLRGRHMTTQRADCYQSKPPQDERSSGKSWPAPPPLLTPGLFTCSDTSSFNKAVIDRRLRPRCCHLGSYIKRPKSSPVRPMARNWYYCAHFIAKPKTACALRFSWVATSSNLGVWTNMTSSIKPEVHYISLRHQRRTELRP